MVFSIKTDNCPDRKNPCGTRATHHHADPGNASRSRLLIAPVLNLIIPAARVIGGLYSGSVAIISDDDATIKELT
ncbi:MAG: hypothetical protein ACP5SH_07285 [Syntrophobacteraceae bacterium]